MKELARQFALDGRSWRTLFVAVSNYVNVESGTRDALKAMLAACKEHNPDPNKKYVVLCGSGDDIKLYNAADDTWHTVIGVRPIHKKKNKRRRLTATPAVMQPLKTFQHAMSYIDEHMVGMGGKDTAVIFGAYGTAVRCASLRTRDRVITHEYVRPTAGMSKADVQQMAMRPAGMTLEVRRKHNSVKTDCYGKPLVPPGTAGYYKDCDVITLMRKSDYVVLQHQHKITVEMLKVTCTGRVEDISKWRQIKVSDAWKEYFAGERMYTAGDMGKRTTTALDLPATSRSRSLTSRPSSTLLSLTRLRRSP